MTNQWARPPEPTPQKKSHLKTGCLIAIAAAIGTVLLIVVIAVGASGPKTTTTGREGGSKAQTTETARRPTIVLQDAGDGAGRTAKFKVTGDFEIRWTWKPKILEGQNVGVFSTFLKGDTAGDLVVNQQEGGKGTYHGDTGIQGEATYYLDINAANGHWTFVVLDV
jgi:hypothetical protein